MTIYEALLCVYLLPMFFCMFLAYKMQDIRVVVQGLIPVWNLVLAVTFFVHMFGGLVDGIKQEGEGE